MVYVCVFLGLLRKRERGGGEMACYEMNFFMSKINLSPLLLSLHLPHFHHLSPFTITRQYVILGQDSTPMVRRAVASALKVRVWKNEGVRLGEMMC